MVKISKRLIFVFALVLFVLALNPTSDHVRHAHAASNGGRWDKRFTSPLSSGIVYASAASGDALYIGGEFEQVGGVDANNIAKWDSTLQTWSALGDGIQGQVYDITIIGEDVFVGGNFSAAGGIAVNHLAKWDGAQWSDVGGGVSDSAAACPQCVHVNVLAANGNDLYVGGTFEQAGNVAASNIAVWNGSAWSALGDGLGACVSFCPSAVFSLSSYDNAVFAYGSFTDGFARWDGTNWSPISHTGSIWALLTQGNDLYAAGSITEVGGVAVNKIARWDGNTWAPLGNGLDSYVAALASDGTNLFVGGAFTHAGEIDARFVAQWDGAEWSALGSGVPFYVETLASSNGLLYVGNESSNNWSVDVWDGNSWASITSTYGQGTVFGIAALENVNGDIYAAAPALYVAGDARVDGLARWDGAAWHNVAGAPREIKTLTHQGTDLYVGGQFGNGLNSIARWDGAVWSGVGNGVTKNSKPGQVLAMAWRGNDLIVAGWFDHAGDVAVRNIARWDGTQWHALGAGVWGKALALAVQGNDVYVGGKFPRAGNTFTSNIAKWDGKRWAALGDGLRGGYARVNALVLEGNRLYAGGQFERSGALNVSSIAMWDGVKWYALGKGLMNGSRIGGVRALAARQGILYAGGVFDNSGGIELKSIAQWNGTAWRALGGGVTGAVEAIELDGADVYIGGTISHAGKKQSVGIARWRPR